MSLIVRNAQSYEQYSVNKIKHLASKQTYRHTLTIFFSSFLNTNGKSRRLHPSLSWARQRKRSSRQHVARSLQCACPGHALGSTTPRGVCSKEGARTRPATGLILPCPNVCAQFRQEPASFHDRLPHRQAAEASGKCIGKCIVPMGQDGFMVFGPAVCFAAPGLLLFAALPAG